MDYPTWMPGIGAGSLIGLIAIAHVLVSHFAVGGGIAMAVIETRAVGQRDRSLRELARRSSTMLILVSTVFGALSGVGIWFAIGLVSPAPTSSLIHNFVWAWAIEWTFFFLEIVTALAWAATWDRVRPRTHLALIWIYAFAAYMSLVVIQGILSFMLTPGRWTQTHSFWDGLLNPGYLPGLVLRTGACLLLAGCFLALAAQREKDAAARGRLVRLLSLFQLGGAGIALAGAAWWQRVSIPGGLEQTYAGTVFMLKELNAIASMSRAALWASFAFALFALARPRWHRWPTAVLALIAAFVFLGGHERVRESARKPFAIRDYMFSNGIRVDQVPGLNEKGVLLASGWVARAGEAGNLEAGEAVFRAECSACHTISGYNSIKDRLKSSDSYAISGFLDLMRSDSEVWAAAATAGKTTVDREQLAYPYMAPFVGTEEEAGALGEYLLHLSGRGLASNEGGRK